MEERINKLRRRIKAYLADKKENQQPRCVPGAKRKLIGAEIKIAIDIRRCYWLPRIQVALGFNHCHWLYLRSWWNLTHAPRTTACTTTGKGGEENYQ